jgi:psp operon transcriptional activator
VRRRLVGYPWPGNVREIKNVVERATYRWGTRSEPIAELEFDPFDSPFRPAGPAEGAHDGARPPAPDPAPALGPSFKDAVREFEVDLLARALEGNRHNQRRTAEALGLTYHQLRGYLRKHDLLPKR